MIVELRTLFEPLHRDDDDDDDADDDDDDDDSRHVSWTWSAFTRTNNGRSLAQPQKPTSKTSSD